MLSLIRKEWIPWVALGIGIYSALFLLIFQPFGEILHNGDPVLIAAIAGFGLVAATIYFIMDYGLRPVYLELVNLGNKWSVISWYLLILFVVSNGIYGYKLMLGTPSSWYEWGETIFRSFILAIIPLMIWWVAGNIAKMKSNHQLHLVSENQRNHLKISMYELLYLRSEDNYSSIITVENGQVCKVLLRGSLTYFEKQINDSSIIRSHRSYLVNLRHVKKFSYNSKGGELQIDFNDVPIPVSKKYLHRIRKLSV